MLTEVDDDRLYPLAGGCVLRERIAADAAEPLDPAHFDFPRFSEELALGPEDAALYVAGLNIPLADFPDPRFTRPPLRAPNRVGWLRPRPLPSSVSTPCRLAP